MTAVKFDKDADGIVTLTLDMPGRSMNVLNEELTRPFGEAIQKIESDATIKGVIITSGKKEFLAGADLDRVSRVTDPQVAFDMAESFKAFLRRLEKCGRPVVAALNGTALGGGFELALGCHARIAINDPKTKFGQPEVKLGLLPGGGATQRLPRMIGIQNSLPLLLEGKELRPEQARQMGIVTELVASKEELLPRAKAWCLANPKPIQPWDDPKYKIPGGDSRHPAVVQVFAIAPSMAAAKTWGNYPAVANIQSCVFEGCLVDFDTGSRIESRYFANCVVSQVAKNMIGTLWFQLNAINKGKSRPEGFEKSTVKKLGILGAGMMGAGIAYVSAKVGMDVVLLDTTQEAADKGKSYSAGLLDKELKKGRIMPADKQMFLDRIKATTKYEDLAGCDLVIEAVFEDRAIKADVTKKAEAVLAKEKVFASNTSTLPITGLAEASVRPKNFIGLHFFSPVDKMPLVEIIKGKKTSPETLARGFDYVQQIKKTPIVVNDSRGFYTSRVFGTYVQEGGALLLDGQHPRSIEVAGLQAGMPVGPLAVHDEVSLSLSLHILDQTRKDLAAEGKPLPEHPGIAVTEKMVKELGRPGKKAGKGFYDYPSAMGAMGATGAPGAVGAGGGGQKHLWPELTKHFPLKEQLPQQDLIDRLIFAMANESAKCYAEGVVETVADTNIGSIFGWGFAPFQGGTLQFINAYGAENFVKRAKELSKQYGERFKPASILVKMAREGKTFVDAAPPAMAAAA